MPELKETDKKIDDIIQKQFDNIVDLSKIDTTIKHWYDTGNLALNYACSKHLFGGIPMGRITSIDGISGTGKSLLAASIMKDPAIDRIIVIETEGGGAAAELFSFAGVDLSKVRMLKANTFDNYRISKKNNKIEDVREEKFPSKLETNDYLYVEGATRLVRRFVDAVRFNKSLAEKKFVIILDSLGNLQSVRELMGTPDMGARSQNVSQFFRTFDIAFEQSNITFIFTNKLYTNIGNQWDPWKATGGVSAEYNPSLNIRLDTTSQTEDITDTAMKDEKERLKNSLGRSIKTIRAKINKSRFGTEMRNAYFLLDFAAGGIARYSGLFKLLKDFGVLNQSGSRYSIDGMFSDKSFYKREFIDMLLKDEKNNLNFLQQKLEEKEKKISDEKSLKLSDIKSEDETIDEEDELNYDGNDLRNAMVSEIEE